MPHLSVTKYYVECIDTAVFCRECSLSPSRKAIYIYIDQPGVQSPLWSLRPTLLGCFCLPPNKHAFTAKGVWADFTRSVQILSRWRTCLSPSDTGCGRFSDWGMEEGFLCERVPSTGLQTHALHWGHELHHGRNPCILTDPYTAQFVQKFHTWLSLAEPDRPKGAPHRPVSQTHFHILVCERLIPFAQADFTGLDPEEVAFVLV